MLTKRERAASVYRDVLSMSRRRVVGVESMVEVTAERLTNVRRAAQLIAGARGTERYSMREPDDARLEEMLAEVRAVVAQLEADSPRWASA